MTKPAELRRRFLAALWTELRVVSANSIGARRRSIGARHTCRLSRGVVRERPTYFTFVTGLTIGYGDLVPLHFVARLIAVVIGFSGILVTGLVAAVGVRALQEATTRNAE